MLIEGSPSYSRWLIAPAETQRSRRLSINQSEVREIRKDSSAALRRDLLGRSSS